jgi:hypothetical protein
MTTLRRAFIHAFIGLVLVSSQRAHAGNDPVWRPVQSLTSPIIQVALGNFAVLAQVHALAKREARRLLSEVNTTLRFHGAIHQKQTGGGWLWLLFRTTGGEDRVWAVAVAVYEASPETYEVVGERPAERVRLNRDGSVTRLDVE